MIELDYSDSGDCKRQGHALYRACMPIDFAVQMAYTLSGRETPFAILFLPFEVLKTKGYVQGKSLRLLCGYRW